jgi:hypothetical protein
MGMILLAQSFRELSFCNSVSPGGVAGGVLWV